MTENLNSSTRLEIPPGSFFLDPTLNFIESYADKLGMEQSRSSNLRKASEVAISMVMKSNEGGRSDKKIMIDMFENDGKLVVEVLNRGVPISVSQTQIFHETAINLDKVSIENLGRQGQTVVLGMRLGEEATRKAIDALGPLAGAFETEEVEIRELRPGEEAALSQLFYFVYGYNYVNEFVYYPEKIKAMREEGKLISIVGATPSGRLAGHVGLIKWNDEPHVYEPCLGVVDPAMKSRGLFGKIFEKTMDRVNETPMQYCFFDFVTNHDLSQRFVSRYRPCELAIFVGCQSKETQAKLERLGLGADSKEMDRYSLLYSIIPRVAHPFGKSVALPSSLGELFEFLLQPLNLSWTPAPRFQMLPSAGDFQTHFQPTQNAVLFDVFCPGRDCVDKILREWSQLLRNGYQYAAVEVPVDSPGLGNLYDIFADHGFFVSGFVPYHNTARLGLRLQAIGPTKVAWEEIKLYSPTAKKLLEIIRSNYERNAFL